LTDVTAEPVETTLQIRNQFPLFSLLVQLEDCFSARNDARSSRRPHSWLDWQERRILL